MRGQVSNSKGFSLIELMVVVAIIGVLATIAIPQVNRFIAKSRTSEAQVNLSSIYTFNKNFYVEYQGYTASFSAMGYIPEGRLRYNMGWGAGGCCPSGYTSLGRTCDGSTNTAAECGWGSGAAITGTCDLIPGPNNAQPTIADGNGTTNSNCSAANFQAVAIARLVADATDMDTWTINDNKSLQNPLDGTR